MKNPALSSGFTWGKRAVNVVRRRSIRAVRGARRQMGRVRLALRDPWNLPRFVGGFLLGLKSQLPYILLGGFLAIDMAITGLLMIYFLSEIEPAPPDEVELIGRGFGAMIKGLIFLTVVVGVKSGWERGYDAVELAAVDAETGSEAGTGGEGAGE